MIALASLLTALALFTALYTAYAVHGRNRLLTAVSDVVRHTQPVDVEAFRNLVDPGEEQFLAANLSPAEFRAIQRQRVLAALDYVKAAFQ